MDYTVKLCYFFILQTLAKAVIRRHSISHTSKRGFTPMYIDKQRKITSKGGKSAHTKGTTHEFTSDLPS
ncbi:hypothetical protein IJ00_12345 [Calothrix sp. 336/3]|nr:hypothetical protein IJ00_12345 [Calothrix sp. 336/3]